MNDFILSGHLGITDLGFLFYENYLVDLFGSSRIPITVAINERRIRWKRLKCSVSRHTYSTLPQVRAGSH